MLSGAEADSRWSRVLLGHEREDEDAADTRAWCVGDSRRGADSAERQKEKRGSSSAQLWLGRLLGCERGRDGPRGRKKWEEVGRRDGGGGAGQSRGERERGKNFFSFS